jgi:hypothetical protein
MGLDYSIGVRITNGRAEQEFEIAYWRKFYALRTETMNIARRHGVIKADEDFFLETDISVLPEIINYLLEECKDRTSEIFSNSIWGSVDGRCITLRQLESLSNWDNLFARFPELLEEESPEIRGARIIDELYDAVERITAHEEFTLSRDEFFTILTHLDQWKFTICFYNSY